MAGLPDEAAPNPIDRRPGDAVPFGQKPRRLMTGSDLGDGSPCQLSEPMPFSRASGGAALLLRITPIVGLRTNPEVRGFDAGTVVAGVHHDPPLRNRAVGPLPRFSVRELTQEATVSVAVQPGAPLEAATRHTLRALPEALCGSSMPPLHPANPRTRQAVPPIALEAHSANHTSPFRLHLPIVLDPRTRVMHKVVTG